MEQSKHSFRLEKQFATDSGHEVVTILPRAPARLGKGSPKLTFPNVRSGSLHSPPLTSNIICLTQTCTLGFPCFGCLLHIAIPWTGSLKIKIIFEGIPRVEINLWREGNMKNGKNMETYPSWNESNFEKWRCRNANVRSDPPLLS